MTIEFRTPTGTLTAWSRRVDPDWLRRQIDSERIVVVALGDGESFVMRVRGGRVEESATLSPWGSE